MAEEAATLSKSVMVPEGHVRVIFRNGVYRRAVGPGGWPLFIPFLESWGPLVKVSAQVHEFAFKEIYSQDRVPLYITLNVEYSFDPRRLSRADAATEIARNEDGRERLVYAQFERALRNVIEHFTAEELEKNPSIEGMEGHIYTRTHRFLRNKGIYIESAYSIQMSTVSRLPPEPEVKRAAAPPIPAPDEDLETPLMVRRPTHSDEDPRFVAKPPSRNRGATANGPKPSDESAPPPEPPELPTSPEFHRPDVLRGRHRRRDIPSDDTGKEQ